MWRSNLVGAGFEEVGGERVAEGVGGHSLVDPGGDRRFAYGAPVSGLP
jgi:hypothetical protein